MFSAARGPATKDGKKVFDASEGKKRRDCEMASLRRNKRVEMMMKRRAEDQAKVLPATTETSQHPAELDALPPLHAVLDNLESSDLSVLLSNCIYLRRISGTKNPPHPFIIGYKGGVVLKRLVELLTPELNPELQLEIVWILTNIASGLSECTSAVVQAGAVPRMLRLLEGANVRVTQQTVWALGNIAGDGLECRLVLLREGIVPVLLRAVDSLTPAIPVELVRLLSWLISNMFRNCDAPIEQLAPLVPGLAKMVMGSDYEAALEAVWGCVFATDRVCALQLAFARLPQLMQKLVEFAGGIRFPNATKEGKIGLPALKAVGNMVRGDAESTQSVFDAGALPLLKQLLEADLELTVAQEEVLWAVSNAAAGTPEQASAVVTSGIIPGVLRMLGTGDKSVRKEAVWVIANISASKIPEHKDYLLSIGAHAALAAELKRKSCRTFGTILTTFRRLLQHSGPTARERASNPDAPPNELAQAFEDAGIVALLDDLVHEAKSSKVAIAAEDLLKDYWPEEEDYFQEDGEYDDAMEGDDMMMGPAGAAAEAGGNAGQAEDVVAQLDDVDVGFS